MMTVLTESERAASSPFPSEFAPKEAHKFQFHSPSSEAEDGMSARSELSPLLIGQISSVSASPSYNELTASRRSNENNEPIEQQQQQRGRANMTRTVVNLMKACLGTGCLALPYACQQGGIITFIIMLISVAAWCLLSVQRLILCLHYLPPDHHDEDRNDDEHQTVSTQEHRRRGSGVGYESSSLSSHKPVSVEIAAFRTPNNAGLESPPPDCTSTLGKVAWHAFGKTGLESVDIMMILCLMGILVSYLVAILGFLQDALFIVTTNNSIGGGGGGQGQRLFNAIIVSSVMFLLSLVPDLGYLSCASLVGLVLLAATFFVITCYGIYDNENNDDTAAATATSTPLSIWPTSEAGLSRLYGVCIFGYGFVPLTYNFRESMHQPERLVSATLCALGGVTSVNALIGIGLYMLFPHVSGEILHELPSTGLLPTVTRLTMAVVAIMTAPLLIVPMGELLEGKWQLEEGHHGTTTTTTTTRWKVRFGICLVSVVIAILFPSFVHVLSFVGCAFVGLVSFCVPPILLLRLRYIKQQQQHHHHHPPRPLLISGVVGTTLPTTTITIESSNAATSSFWTNSWVDVVMAVAGLVATIAGTISVMADS